MDEHLLSFSKHSATAACTHHISANPWATAQLKSKTEIIAYDDNFTIIELTKYIKEIINSKTYSIDNFNKLLKQNEELISENEELISENEELKKQLENLNNTTLKQLLEINELKKIYINDKQS